VTVAEEVNEVVEDPFEIISLEDVLSVSDETVDAVEEGREAGTANTISPGSGPVG